MKYRFAAFAATLLLGGVMVPSAALAQNELNRGSSQDNRPDGRGNRTRQMPARGANASGGAAVNGYGISYHGGPVMLGATKAYYIWYGNWANNSATTILEDFAAHIAPSPYFNINTTYSDAVPNLVTNDVIFGGSTTDNYSRGTALSDADIQTIVSTAIQSNKLPVDFNGVYFVLTSADVNETSGFCTAYCGWHTYGVIQGTNIKYSFVGNPDRCPSACEAQSVGPNGNAGADGMASVIAHELEETVTDPQLNAWYDASGNENADKCAWTFGTTYSVNGAQANMRLGSRDFLIQRNWVNASGVGCALSYTSPAPDFSISANPASSLAITQGASGSSTLTVTSLNGFSSGVSLTVSGCPSNATCTPSVTPVTPAAGGSATSILTIATTANTGTGPFTVTVTGTSGTLQHTATVSGTVNAPPVPNFSISASPSSLTLAQGASGNSTVTVSSSNGFSSAVTLGVSGCPSGATCGLSSGSVTPAVGGSATSTLAVSTGTAAAGTYTLTIAGNSGTLNHSTTVTLKINGPVPDFTISASPSSRTVARGSSTSYTVTIGAVNSFGGAVNFSVSGLPSRVSANFSPNSVTGSGTTTLTITANRSGKTGTSVLTIKGTSGSLSHSTTVSLTIN